MESQEDSEREVIWPLEEEAVPGALEELLAST